MGEKDARDVEDGYLERIDRLWEIILTADRRTAEYQRALTLISEEVAAYFEHERERPKP
jgi:glutamyl-tRNA reductase